MKKARECCIEGCDKITTNIRKGMCNTHYMRYWRHGDPEFRLVNRNAGFTYEEGYLKLTMEDGTFKYEHTVVAEKAIGHPMPKGALVHHVNGIRDDNRPRNLVVCPNQSYHRLLHIRAKQLGYSTGVLPDENY